MRKALDELPIEVQRQVVSAIARATSMILPADCKMVLILATPTVIHHCENCGSAEEAAQICKAVASTITQDIKKGDIHYGTLQKTPPGEVN